MSNAIRYDSLLLAALARTLTAHHAGQGVRGVWLDRAERSLLVRFAARTRRTPDSWLHWRLHPDSGDITVRPETREPAGSTVQIAPGCSLREVATLPDERVLTFELDAGPAAPGFTRRIVVELIGSRWNAYALAADDAITALLHLRERDGVTMRPGSRYTPPVARHRAGAAVTLAHAQFADIVRAFGPGEDLRRALVNDVAYTSPMNATYIVAPLVRGITDESIAEAYARYDGLLRSDDAFILADGRGQPYPSALARTDAVRAPDLVAAFDEVARSVGAPSPSAEAGTVEAAAAAVHEKIRRLDDRVARLSAELRDAAEESQRMRHQADLLFAQLQRVPRGAAMVELDDFAGGTVSVDLDPSLSAGDNATRLYERAKRRDHAAERVPVMIERAAAERAKLIAMRQHFLDGTADAADVAQWSKEVLRTGSQASAETAPLPYRVYHTTGGLEVRAGRNSRANDQLTFHHASPNDIWLHARDLAGSHVVLRWSDRDANPPARDLMEAAVIAAVNSRGRTSGLVPVDWTRRKYVRKPRKAPPGRVMVERSKTLFAVPDAAAERRMRETD